MCFNYPIRITQWLLLSVICSDPSRIFVRCVHGRALPTRSYLVGLRRITQLVPICIILSLFLQMFCFCFDLLINKYILTCISAHVSYKESFSREVHVFFIFSELEVYVAYIFFLIVYFYFTCPYIAVMLCESICT